MDFLVLAFSDLFTWPGAEIVRSWLFLDESTWKWVYSVFSFSTILHAIFHPFFKRECPFFNFIPSLFHFLSSCLLFFFLTSFLLVLYSIFFFSLIFYIYRFYRLFLFIYYYFLLFLLFLLLCFSTFFLFFFQLRWEYIFRFLFLIVSEIHRIIIPNLCSYYWKFTRLLYFHSVLSV